MKKKILYISQVFPYPTDGGGKIKTYNSLRVLAKKFDVYAVFVSEKKPSTTEINHLRKLGIQKVKVFFTTAILDSVKDDLWNLTKNFLQLRPHYVFQYQHAEAHTFIDQAVDDFSPDIIHIDHVNMAQYLPKEKRQIWILESHNLEFYLLWTRSVHSKKLSRKLYLLIEATLTYLFELRTNGLFDYVFAISEAEKHRMQYFFPIKKVLTQPLYYKLEKKVAKKNASETLLFIGNLRWPPNEHAIEWFITDIFPRIKKVNKQVRLEVVGHRYDVMEKRLSQKNLEGVLFVGYQKSLTPYLQKASVFILPFKMGGGIRLKSLTALAHHIPIVSTSLGVEGLKVKNGQEYLRANSAEAFAKKCLQLLTNKKMQNMMSGSQETYMRKYHSNDENRKYLQQYQRIIQESQ